MKAEVAAKRGNPGRFITRLPHRKSLSPNPLFCLGTGPAVGGPAIESCTVSRVRWFSHGWGGVVWCILVSQRCISKMVSGGRAWFFRGPFFFFTCPTIHHRENRPPSFLPPLACSGSAPRPCPHYVPDEGPGRGKRATAHPEAGHSRLTNTTAYCRKWRPSRGAIASVARG